MFTQIKDVIGRGSKFAPFKKEIDAATIVKKAKDACMSIWGPDILDHMHPVSFDNGVLKIAVVSGPASAEVSKRSADIIREINTQCGGSRVEKIMIEY